MSVVIVSRETFQKRPALMPAVGLPVLEFRGHAGLAGRRSGAGTRLFWSEHLMDSKLQDMLEQPEWRDAISEAARTVAFAR